MLKFLPIVQKYTANVNLAKKHNKFAAKAVGDLAKKVFGAIGK